MSPTRMELELHIADAHWVEEERLHHLGRYLIVIIDGDEERPRGRKHCHVFAEEPHNSRGQGKDGSERNWEGIQGRPIS